MSPTERIFGLACVHEARRRLEGKVRRTPLVPWTSPSFHGTQVYLKAENLQVTGAFKARGALNRLLALEERGEAASGVVTASSGNHGQALAWAGQLLGIPVTVVVPEDASPVKMAGIQAYGAQLLRAGTTSRERVARAQELARTLGQAYVSSFDDEEVMAGQGTVGLEILEDLPQVEEILVPVGGGGLLAGVATAVKSMRPGVRVVGVEPEGAAGAYASWRQGRRVELEHTHSLADGLRTLGPGERTWPVLERLVDAFVTVPEEAIRRAVRALAVEAKLVAEPSGAVPAAALLAGVVPVRRGQVLVVSGGNVDPLLLARLLAEESPSSAVGP
jgi:threonine dehydratase